MQPPQQWQLSRSSPTNQLGRNALSQELKKGNADLKTAFDTLKKEKEDADKLAVENKRELDITTALSQFQFRSDAAQQVAFDYVKSRAKRQDDGSLIVEDLPLK